MSNKILVVSAHADDEVLGCGGTIARHVAEGDDVHVVFMADGVGSRCESGSEDQQRRNKARDEALYILGVTNWQALDFPDNRMDSVPLLDVVQALEPIIQEFQPTRIYTHHYGDLNVDHRITHQAVLTACRPVPNSSVTEIYSFEILSSTGWNTPVADLSFVPNHYVDVSSSWKQKIAAINSYQDEMREYPHSRSIIGVESLSKFRGSTVGIEYAEAFQIERSVCNATRILKK